MKFKRGHANEHEDWAIHYILQFSGHNGGRQTTPSHDSSRLKSVLKEMDQLPRLLLRIAGVSFGPTRTWSTSLISIFARIFQFSARKCARWKDPIYTRSAAIWPLCASPTRIQGFIFHGNCNLSSNEGKVKPNVSFPTALNFAPLQLCYYWWFYKNTPR